MPRSKVQSASDDSLGEGREVRRRVVKACQRCRLKKCKCDGDNPCTRCKTDDAICAYGKHRKSDKTVFRRGYVQMLERQHTELISGLQELYRRIQAGEPFPSLPLEPAYNGQPLTHKILEALGVLPSDEDWEDGDKEVTFESMTWQGLEQDGYAYDASTATTSPITQPTTSPITLTPFSPITITPFPQSTLMAKRARNSHHSACMINDNNDNNNNNHDHKCFVGKDAVLSVPPTLNTNVPPSYQNHDIPSASFPVMQQQQQQQQQQLHHHHHQQPQLQQQQPPLQYYNNGDGESGYESIDWIFGCNEDLYNDNQGLVAQLA